MDIHRSPQPRLSVVVVVYNMMREAPRTLWSLSPDYQVGIAQEEYEVVVVENGSTHPLERTFVENLGRNFRYIRIENASPSPAPALNLGASSARGSYLGLMIDGARIATPGVLGLALKCLEWFDRAVVGTLGFHLGPSVQIHAKQLGYDQAVEDELLRKIEWRQDGYRLFEVATLAMSSRRGWLGRLDESNCVFMPVSLFEELAGFAEAFNAPGGGLVNLDFWARACDLPRSTLVTLLGEATFHQYHDGEATGCTPEELGRKLQRWDQQHRQIRGGPFQSPMRRPLIVGSAPERASKSILKFFDVSSS